MSLDYRQYYHLLPAANTRVIGSGNTSDYLLASNPTSIKSIPYPAQRVMNTESPTIDSVHSEILGPSAGIQADVGVSRAVDVHPSSANPQIPDSLARVARKKPRIDAVPQPLEVYLPKMFHLSRLPVELLAEILLYMPSTKSLLAVARCSRYLCATLVSSSSAFIWRNVRMSCNPPIPNPTPNFGEPAYASFIFDDGECEVRFHDPCKLSTT